MNHERNQREQSSVAGPTLWNNLYDEVLLLDYPRGVTLVGLPDDVALVAPDTNERTLMNKFSAGLLMVANWM